MTDRSLAAQLGDLPPGIEALDEEHKDGLARALRNARHRQAAALKKAGDESLRFIPALLRPAIKKAVGL